MSLFLSFNKKMEENEWKEVKECEIEILVAVVPRTDIEQLMRNRKEALKTIFGEIVFLGSSPLISWESEN